MAETIIDCPKIIHPATAANTPSKDRIIAAAALLQCCWAINCKVKPNPVDITPANKISGQADITPCHVSDHVVISKAMNTAKDRTMVINVWIKAN